jgi:hypothetical protein
MEVFHAQEQGFCVAFHGCLVVAIWGREAKLADLMQIAAAQRRAIAQHAHNARNRRCARLPRCRGR